MANLNYKRQISDSFSVKGTLDSTATTVTYEDKDEGTVVVTLQDYLDKFADKVVSISVKSVDEKELELEDEGEE